MPEITFSKNVFLPLTTACSDTCYYCNFKDDIRKANIMDFKEAKRILQKAKKADCKEVLITFGSKPHSVYGFKEKLRQKTGYESIYELLLDICKEALKIGLLPHSNPGLIDKDTLGAIARYNASMGLMLETTAEVSAHKYSPTKSPQKRLKFIENAGKLKIPFTTGLLIGIGEREKDRRDSLLAIKKLHMKYAHIQEVIIQPIKSEKMPPVKYETIKQTVHIARQILPEEIKIQVPPNLEKIKDLLDCGVRDLGGISPITYDYINPDFAWPAIKSLEKELAPNKLKERLAVYPRYINQKWVSREVLECMEREGWLDEKCCSTGS
ncbi:7,8-didemethyl-8-hydroxy-5-deazariboflavin synthase subunit CofG [Natranaerofaba carboxydovora]|uniref:7,8-didemethyl-8-hydroxy-5-deazariboflavin synthase subunit CofG n=1 Tax=Natranaerofaba carboxydovora TaxID=2742683 RepID=UPI001F130F0B|nr:7,8-didemethyl-8-hydroxy-5-deazariboflavin synthase subunit CofG [Natranaerofaba carboxydovora]UMZ73683.1 FO synthase [Natranaerofaba carboxydovora]